MPISDQEVYSPPLIGLQYLGSKIRIEDKRYREAISISTPRFQHLCLSAKTNARPLHMFLVEYEL